MTPAGISIDVRLLQSENAQSPILVNRLPSVKVTLSRLLHPENAEAPILVTPEWMVIEVKLVQPLN